MPRHQPPPQKPMYLIDHWEALARNTQYAKDYRHWQRHSMRLESKFEMGGTLDQIKDRIERAARGLGRRFYF